MISALNPHFAGIALRIVCTAAPPPPKPTVTPTPPRDPAVREGVRAAATAALELMSAAAGGSAEATAAAVAADWLSVSLSAEDIPYLLVGAASSRFRAAVASSLAVLESSSSSSSDGSGGSGVQALSDALGRLLCVLLLRAAAAADDTVDDVEDKKPPLVAASAAELAEAAARLLRLGLSSRAGAMRGPAPSLAPSGGPTPPPSAATGRGEGLLAALALARGAWLSADTAGGARLRRLLWRLARSGRVPSGARLKALRLATGCGGMVGPAEAEALVELIADASPEGAWVRRRWRRPEEAAAASDNDSVSDEEEPSVACEGCGEHRRVNLVLRSEAVAELAGLLAAPGQESRPAAVATASSAASAAVEQGLADLAAGKATAVAVAAALLMGGALDLRRGLQTLPVAAVGKEAYLDEEAMWMAAETDVLAAATGLSIVPCLSDALTARCCDAASAALATAELASGGGTGAKSARRRMEAAGLAARCMKALWERLPTWCPTVVADPLLLSRIISAAAAPAPLPLALSVAVPAPRVAFVAASGAMVEDGGRRAVLRAGMRIVVDAEPATGGRHYLELLIVKMVRQDANHAAASLALPNVPPPLPTHTLPSLPTHTLRRTVAHFLACFSR